MVAMGHGSPVDLGLGNSAWTLRAWNNEMEDLFNNSSCAPLVLQTGPGGSSRGKFKGQRDQSRIYIGLRQAYIQRMLFTCATGFSTIYVVPSAESTPTVHYEEKTRAQKKQKYVCGKFQLCFFSFHSRV